MRSHILLIAAAAMLVTAISDLARARAAIVTQTVEFFTPSTGSQNQITIAGALNTLSQALGIVDFGSTSVNVDGLLRARLTMSIPEEGDIEVIGFDLLESSFNQSGVSLFYDVPNTARRVTFSATGLQFGLQLTGQTNDRQLLTTARNVPANSYQMLQNSGTAQVGITNRPSVTQNLAQQSVLSAYQSNESVGEMTFSILPPADGSEEPLMELTLPLTHQQFRYTGVGLPVTLNYSGSLRLIAPLPLVSNQIPEPNTLLLLITTLTSCGLLRRRSN